MFDTDGFSIICEAQKGRELGISHLVLVDQFLDDTQWWTSDDPSTIMRYRSRAMADKTCERFTRNNARVVHFSDALALISAQNREVALRTLERLGQNNG